MALTVETGAGLANAESFVSVANAQTYLENLGALSSSWTGATVDRQEDALRAATVYLEAVYRGRWPGSINLETQALAWPRTGGYDQEERLIDSDSVPLAVAKACAVAADNHIINASDGGLFPTVDNPGNIIREKVGVGRGAIEEETEYSSGGKNHTRSIPLIGRLLATLVAPKAIGGRTHRV